MLTNRSKPMAPVQFAEQKDEEKDEDNENNIEEDNETKHIPGTDLKVAHQDVVVERCQSTKNQKSLPR